MPSPGQQATVVQQYQNILAKNSQEATLKSQVDELKSKLDAVRTMPVAEIATIIPLALQCTQSANALVREAGIDFFFEMMGRFDSANVLEPYIDDLGKLADEKDNPLRQGILFILGSLLPKIPDKAIAYLEANLERGSTQEASAITASLLKASRGSLLHPVPADPSIVHKVIAFTTARADEDLTSNVLHELGLYRIQIPEAINFISANLNESNPRLRAAAVEGASRLDKDARAQLRGQLSQIASDPKEVKEVRQQAVQALEP
jgi:hypothetical protein